MTKSRKPRGDPPLEEIGRDAIPDFRNRPATLSTVYLSQAIESFGESGDPATLYGPLYGRSDLNPTQRGIATIEGRRVQIERRLRAVLFSALAAESYVNEFLGAHFEGGDLKAVDRMRPIDKFVIGTRLGLGEDLFERDRPPIPALERLFKLRNRLVHPKPGFGPAFPLGPLGDFEEQFTGRCISDFVVAVASAGLVLVKRTYGPDHLDLWTDLAWFGRDILVKHGEDSERLPEVEADGTEMLISRLFEARSRPGKALA